MKPPAMFAKRQPAFAGATERPAGPRLSARALLDFAKRPWVGPVAAGILFLGAGAILVLVAGDPRAGAPSVRIGLDKPKPAAQAQMAPNAGMEAFTVDSLGMYQDLAAPGFEVGDTGPVQGQAVITLPEGGSDGPAQGVRLPPPLRTPSAPLPSAPLPGLTQQNPIGPLPAIAPDGRTPFGAYARPFKPDGRPKVALVVGGLGLNAAATKVAIERLPGEITLSFVPYAEGLQGWIDLARAHGHEVMLEIPMEPNDYPDNDPGPYTLLTGAQPAETVKRLEWLLSRAQGYFGVTNYLGQKFVNNDGGMNAFLGVLKARGVAFVDDGQARRRGGAFARASAETVVDEDLTAESIAAQLTALEQAARTRGAALGSGFAYPVTVETAARWAATLQARGIQLAPASALARR